MKLLINEDKDKVEEKYADCHTYFWLDIFNSYIHWFIDYGEWFIQIGCSWFHIRLSSAGSWFRWK